MEGQISLFGESYNQVFMFLDGGEWKLESHWEESDMPINVSDSPCEPIKTRLSDILERNVNTKYHLSEKACRGILRRAGERGKDLPKVLRDALCSTAGVDEIEAKTFSKKSHPRNKNEKQGWKESNTAHAPNLFA